MVRGSNPNSVPNFYRDTLQPLLLSRDKITLINWLSHHGLIQRQCSCLCGQRMTMIKRSAFSDGYAWYCSCRKEKSIRANSWLAQFPRVPLQSLVQFIWRWCDNLQVPKDDRQRIVSKRTAHKISNTLKDICCETMDSEPVGLFGGRGHVVHIDESVFRRRKYNRGRRVETRWVFGMTSCQFNTPRPVFYVVRNRNRDILQPLILKHCLPGTTIHSDQWRAYANLSTLGYVHRTVNHSRYFTDPATGVHTNNIEAAWMWAKAFIRSRKVYSDVSLHFHLQCYMWRAWKGQPHRHGCFGRLLDDMARLYPQL